MTTSTYRPHLEVVFRQRGELYIELPAAISTTTAIPTVTSVRAATAALGDEWAHEKPDPVHPGKEEVSQWDKAEDVCECEGGNENQAKPE